MTRSGKQSAALSRDEVRDLDRQAVERFAVPSLLLMENAGRGATDVLVSLGIQGPVAICCGKGNNGGDGMVVARQLAVRGHLAQVHLFADPEQLTGDAAAQWAILDRLDLPRHIWPLDAMDLAALAKEWKRADWIVDGLYGTGLLGPVRAPLDRVIESINQAFRKVLALDIPSGLDADTGLPQGAIIRADHTVTFAAWKRGFEQPHSQAYTGVVHLADIGVPVPLPAIVETLE